MGTGGLFGILVRKRHWYEEQITEMAFIKRICSMWQQFKWPTIRNGSLDVYLFQFECSVAFGILFIFCNLKHVYEYAPLVLFRS